MNLSKKGQELVGLYHQMASDGYDRIDDQRVDVAFSDFELRACRSGIQSIFEKYAISSVLDYGCGGSNWKRRGFDDASGQSAMEYFKLQAAYRYEPARAIDERQTVDCVVSFDVLEHIFIVDVPAVIRDMFKYASRLLILNVACYPAAAKLPNGENAHVTNRHPLWWKGMIDGISADYSGVSVQLICSTGWRRSSSFPIWNANMWKSSSTFVVDD